MKIAKFLTGTAAVLLTGLALTIAAPKAAHAVVATLVQVANTTANPVPTVSVVPATPFFGRMQLSGNTTQSVGPGTGTLAVTQLVLTNTGSTLAEVNVYAGLLLNGTCGGTNNVAAGTDPFQIFEVPANSSLVVPAPTPVAYTPQTGFDNVPHTCLAAGMPITGGNVFVTVNGYLN